MKPKMKTIKTIFHIFLAMVVWVGTMPPLTFYAFDTETVEILPANAPIEPTTGIFDGYDYYILTEPGHLAWMQANQNVAALGLATSRFRVGNDIIAPDNFRFTPQFNGVFDGNGHTIAVNTTLNAPTGGLFSNIGINGVVRNIHVTGIVAPAAGGNNVGGIIGNNNGHVENSSASVTVTHTGSHVGGLVGANNGTIYNSHATGNVSGGTMTGGLVGHNGQTIAGSFIQNSFASGNVHGLANTGGLVGINTSSRIEGSHAEGNVIGGNPVGGLVGSNVGNSEIIHSHALGNVRGNVNAGGLVGRNGGTSSITLSFAHGEVEAASRAGGLVGENINTATIDRTFATGNVRATGAGNHGTGGLVGALMSGSVNDSYARGNISGTNINSGALIGLNQGSVTNAFATGNVVGNNNNVGGLVGNSVGASASLTNSVALNSQLIQTAGNILTRRANGTAPGTRTNNFAIEGMILNGIAFESLGRPANDMDAHTITFEEAQNRDFWENEANFDFDTIWEWRGEDDYHPIVLNMGGQVFVDVRGLPVNTIPGDTVQLRYAVSRPSGATYTTIIWSVSGNTSSNTTIDQNGYLTIGWDESPGSVITVTASTSVSFTEGASTNESGSAATVVIYGDYAIALSPNPVIFTSQTVGYNLPQLDDRTVTITITNAGNQPTGPLAVSIDSITAFNIRTGAPLNETLTINSIPFGAASSFMVTFQQGLTVGVHTATITVSGNNGIYETIPVTFTVMENETWDISLSTTGTHVFPQAYEGYTAQEPHTVTVTQSGNRPTGALTIALSGDNALNFTLSTTSLPSLGTVFDTTATFTVVPNTSLPIGIHTATVTVTGDNNISETFDIEFEVALAPIFSIGLTPSGAHDFGTLNVGYTTAPTAHSVTVTNTGNQNTGSLSITLGGTNASAFTVSTNTVGSLAINGTDAFTIQPNLGLGEGTYTATVTVSGDNGISATFTVSFQVTVVPVYGISLTPYASHTFPGATLGYGAQTAHSVTITNTGNQPTGLLTIALSDADASSFTLSTTSVNSLANAGDTTAFTVVPNMGLAVGTYTATVTVSGGNNISESFDISFTVSPAPTFSIALNPAADHTFPSLEVGYTVSPTALSVVVTNTGNQPTGDLAISLTGANASSFWLSTTTIPNLEDAISVASFSVQPFIGLSVGTHTATVTVSGGNGISHSFSVTFVVEETPVYSISLAPATDHDFGTLIAGYITAPATHSVVITNTGNRPTGSLNINLSGINPSHFALSTTGAASLAPYGETAFTIQPVTGLAVGDHSATVTATGDNGITLAFNVTFTVLPLLYGPTIVTYNAPNGRVGNAYQFQFGATGYPEPTWSTAGTLPPGLTLNENGLITGVPTQAGTFTFEVTVSNSEGEHTVTVTITISQPPVTDPGSNPGDGSESNTGNPPGGDSDNNTYDDPSDYSPSGESNEPSLPPTITHPVAPPESIPEPAPDIQPESPSPMYHHAFMVGRPDGRIYPHAPITRAEAAVIFFRLLDDQTRIGMWRQDNPFLDVNLGDWFNNEVSTIANMGIVEGRLYGQFAPNETITRAEAVAMAARFFNYPIPEQSGVNFTDITGHWAESYIQGLAHFQWVQGDGDGRFRPDHPMTRAEFAAMVTRMLNRVPESVEALLPAQTIWADNRNRYSWYYLYLQEASHSTQFERLESGYIRWLQVLPHIDWTVFSKPNAKPDDILIYTQTQ